MGILGPGSHRKQKSYDNYRKSCANSFGFHFYSLFLEDGFPFYQIAGCVDFQLFDENYNEVSPKIQIFMVFRVL